MNIESIRKILGSAEKLKGLQVEFAFIDEAAIKSQRSAFEVALGLKFK